MRWVMDLVFVNLFDRRLLNHIEVYCHVLSVFWPLG